ncbi:MAG: glycosyltransferase family 4 protein [Eubacterium sp.]|nr:glycosyltransferase family 4 protein [Eubacterium sp.]
MNILFMTLGNINNIDNNWVYEDLLREFYKNGHRVYIVSPTERQNKEKTHIIEKSNCKILKVRTGNIQKTNLIEKGIATVTLETHFIFAVKKYFGDIKFDLILYSTPPVTLVKPIRYIKKRDNAKTYLLLKDIFPQNAVDIGILSKKGIKGIIYKYFRRKEKELYAISDKIGCMSPANVNYILKNNFEINSENVEVCPNSIEPRNFSISEEERIYLRKKYSLPLDRKVFVYGGNLGKPQGIPFIIECLRKCQNIDNVFFLIVGNGTEYGKLKEFLDKEKPHNAMLLKYMPKDEYDKMIAACDAGLIFLDHRFTIPNFPSRLLSYMQAKLPVLAATDVSTDIGKIIVDGGFGWWCESNDTNKFYNIINNIDYSQLSAMGQKSMQYLADNYCVKLSYKIITESLNVDF